MLESKSLQYIELYKRTLSGDRTDHGRAQSPDLTPPSPYQDDGSVSLGTHLLTEQDLAVHRGNVHALIL